MQKLHPNGQPTDGIMYVFSSANAIKKYDVRQLVELGVEWIWLGLESGSASYATLKGTDTLALARTLQ